MTSSNRTHAMSITAAIANAPQEPFEIATCELGDPQQGEVLVRVHACGICHTDMAVKLQHIPIPCPKCWDTREQESSKRSVRGRRICGPATMS